MEASSPVEQMERSYGWAGEGARGRQIVKESAAQSGVHEQAGIKRA